jgi:Ni,Fe-hydrogenase III large subunit
MTATRLLPLGNGGCAPLDTVPVLALDALQQEILAAVGRDLRVVSLFAEPAPTGAPVRFFAVLADDLRSTLLVGSALVQGTSFPALTPRCPQLHLFEREIAEQTLLHPDGHPWRKPVRFAPPLGQAAAGPRPAIGMVDWYRVEGEEVHEVAVGPVHAGVIEPGHFRFQCHGEHVFHLEISLGYQHRGVEEALVGGPHPITLHQIATLAGDTTIGHATAYCQNLEALAAAAVPAHAQFVRAIGLELERLANHTGDLGALAGDVGFLPTASYCGRIRGDFLNMTALLCGNRFGRGLLRPGGCRFCIEPDLAAELKTRLQAAHADVRTAVELLWITPSIMARFENTGTISTEVSSLLGLVGPAARACGQDLDVRTDHPTGAYRFLHLPPATAQTGDVLARAFVRWLEIQRSIKFLQDLLAALPAPATGAPPATMAKNHLAVSLIEGWRGEICHVAITDHAGRFARYKVVDPSFHNWAGLAMALRDQQISDFPLCNKSFNLSYCGHDL